MESNDILKQAPRKTSLRAVAAELGVALSLIYQRTVAAADDGSGSRNPLDRLHKVIELSGDKPVVEWLCRRNGRHFVVNPEFKNPEVEHVFFRPTTQRFGGFACCAGVVFALLGAVRAPAADGVPAADGEPAAQPGWPRFRVQELHQDRNEGIAVADYNRDGQPDISAGEFWYEGPAFTAKRPLRKLEPFGGGEYLTNNGEHALDLNLDGFPDILTGSFMDRELSWYENPGAEGLREGRLWTRHLLVDTGLQQNEATMLADIDGDGRPELLVNHWQDGLPMRYYKITPRKEGPLVETVTVAGAGDATNGHGVGVGDLNGSGRMDIIYKNGWYEQLADGSWRRHAAWTKPFMSVPALVLDANGDGRNDILWGNGHDYGLFWEEQLPSAEDGTLQWRRHQIDDSWSQAHVLVWHDLDGDGRAELITGKRYYGHGGKDPGANDGLVLYAYKWRAAKAAFERHPIVVSKPGQPGPGVGLQLRVADLNGDGRPDLAATGKSGTYIIWNEG